MDSQESSAYRHQYFIEAGRALYALREKREKYKEIYMIIMNLESGRGRIDWRIDRVVLKSLTLSSFILHTFCISRDIGSIELMYRAEKDYTILQFRHVRADIFTVQLSRLVEVNYLIDLLKLLWK